MTIPEDTQQIYEQLALECQRRKETLKRDVFLVLAADSAHTLGRAAHAQRLYRQLLQLSPSTMLRPFASFAEALGSSDVLSYVCDLRQQYPPETAAQMLDDCSAQQPTDLFDSPTVSDIDIPASEPLFGDSKPGSSAELSLRLSPSVQIPAATTAALLRHAPAPLQPPARPENLATAHAASLPPPATAAESSSAPLPAPGVPSKPRRRSPYDNPDYGPKVPPTATRSEDDAGIWFIHLLAALVGLAGIGVAAYVFLRPFLGN